VRFITGPFSVGTENISSRTYTLGFAASDVNTEGSRPPANPFRNVPLNPAKIVTDGEQEYIDQAQRCF
jgi:hypothetical protein